MSGTYMKSIERRRVLELLAERRMESGVQERLDSRRMRMSWAGVGQKTGALTGALLDGRMALV